MSWKSLSSMSPTERLVMLGSFIDSVMDIDPSLSQAAKIWNLGKTVAVECRLGDMSLRIYLSATPALVNRLADALREGRLEMSSGTADIGGRQVEALVGSMGSAAVSVTEAPDGGLLVTVAHMRAVALPEGPREGEVVPFPLPGGEGFTVLPFEGSILLVGAFAGLRRQEVQAASKGTITVGLARFDERLCSICLRIPGLLTGWTDLPFALGVERPENRRLSPPSTSGGMKLVLVAGDALTGLARVVRPLAMSRAWTSALHDILEAQHDAGEVSRADYEALVRASRERWPTPDDVARDFVVVEKVGRP